jgi:hypothetical protein
MSEFPLCIEQVLKQEQYKDLIRDAEHYRTIKAEAPSQHPCITTTGAGESGPAHTDLRANRPRANLSWKSE